MKKRYISLIAAGMLVLSTAMVAQAEVVIVPYLSALQSTDTDLVVEFNASRAACYDKSIPQPTCTNPLPDISDPDPINHIAGGCSDDGAPCFTNGDCYDPQVKQTITDLTCTYTWDFGDGGAGAVVGGTGAVITYEYAVSGTYDVSLTVTEPVSGASENNTVTVEAVIVEPPGKTADFSTSATGNAVTLSFDAAPAGLAKAYIYWGDRKRSSLINPATGTTASHTYTKAGTYNIRVQTLDGAHNGLNYTFADDADLAVTLP
ncbi:MAG: PKD domain-containing protein [Deltaproteobacteria bacterium]|nr:PKD domain-containing protein [Deltaproteobacteria bacterium]